ncbi:hypothetical protein GCM10007895_01030 [Paraferrimonas sedimenticola]|uniref:Uncharacterized protein n=2 Tax=Paraferrimonas sedimenticola TaxID=375674 RepID=A0AA37W0B3_9GAMM|nr:hypothetical protein GCM10007895_01030 [Paraferrimonas sedimenticola]
MQSDSIGWGVDWRLQPKQVVVNHNQWRQELGLHSQTDYGTSPWNDKQQAQLGFGFTSLSNHQVQVGAGLNPGEQSRAQLDLNAPALSFYVKYAYEQQLQVRFDWHTQAPLHNHSANMGNHAGVQDAISNVRPSPFFGLSVSYSM